MRRVVLTGHGGSGNRGCEAIVRCTVDIIRRHTGASQITIVSHDPSADRAALFPDLEHVEIVASCDDPKRYSLGWVARGVERRAISRLSPGLTPLYAYKTRKVFAEADVVLSVGGDNFTDCYGGPSDHFGELRLARSLGTKTAIWGASIGPFREEKLERVWADHLRRLDLITAREEKTVRYLKSIGVEENVSKVADPAFLLRPQADGTVSLPSDTGCVVGLGMSAVVSRYGSTPTEYLRAFVELGSGILAEPDTRLLLIPHVVFRSDDDVAVCRQLAAMLPRSDRVTVVSHDQHNARQMKHIIGRCDYFVGARTHSTIAALSSLVPTLSVAYSSKAWGLNMDVFGHTDFVVPIQNISGESLLEKFTVLRARRHDVIRHLEGRVPAIKAKADSAGPLLRDLLKRDRRFESSA